MAMGQGVRWDSDEVTEGQMMSREGFRIWLPL